jgi:hypothetical protein
MIFRFLQEHEIKRVAVAAIVDYLGALVLPDPPATESVAGPAAVLAGFRRDHFDPYLKPRIGSSCACSRV